jgi:hypothetical protein
MLAKGVGAGAGILIAAPAAGAAEDGAAGFFKARPQKNTPHRCGSELTGPALARGGHTPRTE